MSDSADSNRGYSLTGVLSNSLSQSTIVRSPAVVIA